MSYRKDFSWHHILSPYPTCQNSVASSMTWQHQISHRLRSTCIMDLILPLCARHKQLSMSGRELHYGLGLVEFWIRDRDADLRTPGRAKT